TTLEQTANVLVAEVPAAVALAQVAAQRRHVADLGCRYPAGGAPQCREMLLDRGVVGDRGDLGAGADDDDRRVLLLDADALEVLDGTDADHLRRLGDVLLLEVEQIGATAQQVGRAPSLGPQARRRLGAS